MTNVEITENWSAASGGGLNSSGAQVTLVNVLVANNSADIDAGGIADSGVGMTLTNVTVTDNVADMWDGGIQSWDDALTLNNTVVAGNEAPEGDNDLAGNYTAYNSFVGSVDGDAMLVDYLPQAGSPLIDAGDNALALDAEGSPLTTDIAGNPRIRGARVDIGAYESPWMMGDADDDGDVDLDDFVILKINFGSTTALWPDGDFDGNGTVDLDDFVLLKSNFGSGAVAAAAAVPVAQVDLLGEASDATTRRVQRRRPRRMARRRADGAAPNATGLRPSLLSIAPIGGRLLRLR